jgi:hypothetical protein
VDHEEIRARVRYELESWHTAPARSVTKAQLAGTVGCSPREVEASIQSMRSASLPIGSSSREGSLGYFWAMRPDDLAVTEAHLRNRIRNMLVTWRGVRRARARLAAARPSDPNGQGVLFAGAQAVGVDGTNEGG